ncbi:MULTISPECIES: antibiotic biosynthesis monooxygenase [unclassified Lysobacter]|uniref:antibiotic biosynthesis monooxygenase n=1 Tax=unclassified Lysobacter TaxID=2635362 RepID=UPI0006F7518B|nr:MULTISPECIES: antibiotic biosynthesis monooxygenase [unclassified Lysobacter]KRA20882.1 NIPSNAP family containing protein [Lysobacter sp. Root604]KRD39890.1 NIPSNAP family containing protein [Lysobacter sp. Root916]
MQRLIEVRTYRLKPESGTRFEQVMTRRALPLLRERGMDVVAFGRSRHEHESWYLIRAYRDQADLVAQQDAFYSSAIWREGPRADVVGCIEDYLNTLLWLSDAAIDELRTAI